MPGRSASAIPGCYATAMQLAIAPLLDRLAGPPQCFGVSGYSGAGTTPSDKNDVRQAARQPDAVCADRPHARARGLAAPGRAGGIHAARGPAFPRHHHDRQPVAGPGDEGRCDPRTLPPSVTPASRWSGFSTRRPGSAISPAGMAWRSAVSLSRRAASASWSCATLDNLLKGAATQAMQNLNLAFGFDEFTSIPMEEGA